MLWVSRDYPLLWRGIPGPAYVPRLIFCLLIGLSILLLVQVARGKYQDRVTSGRMGLVGTSVAISLLYLYLAPRLHYFIITPIFLVVMMRLLKIRRWKMIIIVSAIFTAFVYLVFYRKLGVPLP